MAQPFERKITSSIFTVSIKVTGHQKMKVANQNGYFDNTEEEYGGTLLDLQIEGIELQKLLAKAKVHIDLVPDLEDE